MEQVEKKCPSCGARMYQRKVKKDNSKGEMGWGCPCCFILLPEHKPKLTGIFGMIKSMFPDIEVEIREEEPFDFWKKNKKNKPKEDSDDAE